MTDRGDQFDNMLRGAPAISTFMFGDDTDENVRKVYYEASKKRWPIFRDGNLLCALKDRMNAAKSAEAEAQVAAAAAAASDKEKQAAIPKLPRRQKRRRTATA
jgi:hypothetical protein